MASLTAKRIEINTFHGKSLSVPNFVSKLLPESPEKLRKVDEKLQENATYAANAGAALLNIPIQLAVNKGDFNKALHPILLVGSYDLASIIIQALSWKVGAKYLQPILTKFIGASAENNEALRGIIGKLLALVFWVGIFPVINSFFDGVVKNIYLKLTGQSTQETPVQQMQKAEQRKGLVKALSMILGTIVGSVGLGMLFKKPIRGLILKLIEKVDLKKINQLLLDCEQFAFIPITSGMRFLVEHFMNHKQWSKAFEDTLPFLMIQSANFVSQIGVVSSKKALVSKFNKYKITDKAGNTLPINAAMKAEPSSVQNIAFSVICAIKDFFIPVIGLGASGLAEKFFDKSHSRMNSMVV